MAGPLGDLPIGTIIVWPGALESVPEGWHLCDGQDGAVDLRARMVMGASVTNAAHSTGEGATGASIGAHDHVLGAGWETGAGSGHTHSGALYSTNTVEDQAILGSGGLVPTTYAASPVDHQHWATMGAAEPAGSSTNHKHTLVGGDTGGGSASGMASYLPYCQAQWYIQRLS